MSWAMSFATTEPEHRTGSGVALQLVYGAGR